MAAWESITGDEVIKRLERERGKTQVEIVEGGLRLALEVADLDRIGVAVNHLEMEVTSSQPMLAEERNQRSWMMATTLTDCTTYLLEKLGLVEWDKEVGTLLIRSSPPDRSSKGIAYYEVSILGGTFLSLDRYVFCNEKRMRERRAMHFTREVFARLIDHLVEGCR